MNSMDIISNVRRQPGMSDAQLEREHEVSARLWKAMCEMALAIDAVNTLSAVVQIDPQAFQDFVHDEVPSRLSWLEKINAARRGY